MFEFDSLAGILIIVFPVLVLTLWLWALTDIIKDRRLNNEPVGMWILIILLFPIVGFILYFQIAKGRMIGSKKGFNPDFKGYS